MKSLNKLNVRHIWNLGTEDPTDLLPRVIRLLVLIQENGSLAKACEKTDMSYRHAWGVLHDAAALFGQPLMTMKRGKGTELTELGMKLIWAERRIAARLEPLLAQVSSELLKELDQTLKSGRTHLRIDASHCFAMESLHRHLNEQDMAVGISYCGSLGAVERLLQGRTDVAGFHLAIADLSDSVFNKHRDICNEKRFDVQILAQREQGVMVRAGNPLKIRSISDLANPQCRFINRQPGSGTRLLFNKLLLEESMTESIILQPYPPEHTHAAVAAFVASGMADAGFGVRAAATRFGLEFIPLERETYFVAHRVEDRKQVGIQALQRFIESSAFRQEISKLPGYSSALTGMNYLHWLELENQASP
jgi:molybdate transport repressor ModE-like protein